MAATHSGWILIQQVTHFLSGAATNNFCVQGYENRKTELVRRFSGGNGTALLARQASPRTTKPIIGPPPCADHASVRDGFGLLRYLIV
jgi:hypothetical protein